MRRLIVPHFLSLFSRSKHSVNNGIKSINNGGGSGGEISASEQQQAADSLQPSLVYEFRTLDDGEQKTCS